MGLIYSPAEIAKERYPQPGDHQKVASKLIEQCIDWRGEQPNAPDLESGMVYGSVAYNNANTRSDVDFLVILPNYGDEAATLSRLAKMIVVQTSDSPVSVEVGAVSKREIAARSHPFTEDSLFAEHLVTMASNSTMSFGNPHADLVELSEFSSSNDQEVAASRIAYLYTAIKRNEFFKDMAARARNEPNYYRLQRAFELPSAMSRKLVRLSEIRDNARNSIIPSVYSANGSSCHRKSLVERGIQLSPDNYEWQSAMSWLAEEDANYNELLKETINGRTTLNNYENYLQRIYRPAIDRALELSIAATAIISSILQGA